MINIPTIAQLYTSIKANLEAEYGTTLSPFGKSWLRTWAKVEAAKLKIVYLLIGKLQKNIFIDTADPESSGGTLERFGRIKLGRSPFPATAGQYTVTVTGTIGAVIPASTTFKSNDDSINPGKLFMLDLAYTLIATTDTITIRALEAGVGSKLIAGNKLTATAPIAAVNKLATVTAESVEPFDSETVEEYRRKGLEAYRLEPNGGSAGDYRLWASDAQGVQRVYPYARTGFANEINLFVEATVIDSTDGKGTPSAGLLSDVEDVIELDPDVTKPIYVRGRRPLAVHQIHYLPVVIKEIDIEIPGFVGLTAPIQAAIATALTAEINKIRPFVSGADVLELKNDILDVNKIVSVILTVRPGSTFGAIVLKVATVPLATFVFINGDIPHLNTITYT